MNLLKNVKIDQILGYFAAGQAAKTSDIIDMQGYDGVLFVAGFGTIVEAGTLNVQVYQDTDSAGGTMAAVAGTAAHTVTAANAALTQSAIAVDVYKPLERYLEVIVTPATQDAVILGVTAIRYKGKMGPDANADLLKSTQLISPAEA
jgi:diaminopimelate epimerase